MNTFAKSAKPALRRLSSTGSRKSPAPSAPARKPQSSFLSSPPPTAAAMAPPPNPPSPLVAAEAAAVVAAAAAKVGQPFLAVSIDDFECCLRVGLRSEEHTSELQSRQYLVC